MKPVYLEFCGVNSFSEKTEIDFNALISGGVFGIGWLIDLIKILINKFTDKQGIALAK